MAEGGTGVDEGDSGGKVMRGILMVGITKWRKGVGVTVGSKIGKLGNLKLKSAKIILLCREINIKKRVTRRAIFLFIYVYFNTNMQGVNM